MLLFGAARHTSALWRARKATHDVSLCGLLRFYRLARGPLKISEHSPLRLRWGGVFWDTRGRSNFGAAVSCWINSRAVRINNRPLTDHASNTIFKLLDESTDAALATPEHVGQQSLGPLS
jgi:hypothetical protein